MIIKSFEYHEYKWDLDSVPFDSLNLMVGKNAVGKSKTLKSLIQVARFVKGDTSSVVPYFGYRCKLVFKLDDDGGEMEFSYSIGDNSVIESEFLKKGDEIVVTRKKSEARIKGDSFNPPTNKLCVQSQRDTTRYPEFEMIMTWAEQIKGFSFSGLSSSHSDDIPSMFNESIDISELYEHIDNGKKDFVENKMRELNYDIENIDLMKISDRFRIVTVKEKGINLPLLSHTMSNGMLRVFYIFSYLTYLSSETGAKTLLIDDLGEGLDYSRSKKLSNIIFDYCEEKGIQLIVTTNDSFLMNAVDLKYWIILHRDKEHVTAISEKTNPDVFAKFKRMGLNNFDMFSTDFLAKNMKIEKK